MTFDELQQIIKTACDQVQEDTKEVVPHTEYSIPYAVNKALSKRLNEAGLPAWLINVLILDNKYCEWGDSVNGECDELVYQDENTN